MGRHWELPEPLASLADRAGSVTRLREAMGSTPSSTFNRWKQAIMNGEALPLSATNAIKLADMTLPAKKDSK